MSVETKFADFLSSQDAVYGQVRSELAAGRKQSHWVWFIFPQLYGLGHSSLSKRFGIASQSEALSYIQHPVLGARLRECVQLLLECRSDDILAILGTPDDLKFRSCLTLFACAAPEEPIFQTALDKFYGGKRDEMTLNLLGQDRQSHKP